MRETITVYEELKWKAEWHDHSLCYEAYLGLADHYSAFSRSQEEVESYLDTLSDEDVIMTYMNLYVGEGEYEEYRNSLVRLAEKGKHKGNDRCLTTEEIMKMSQLEVLENYYNYLQNDDTEISEKDLLWIKGQLNGNPTEG